MNERLVTRLSIFMLTLGGLIAWFYWGRDAVIGFAAGAIFSLVNYRALHRVVSTIGLEEVRGSKTAAVFFAVRYLVLLGVGYVIVGVSETSLRAAMIGLFVSIAAVILASLYDVYAGT